MTVQALPLAQVSYRAYRVWQRNRDTFLRLWKTSSWPEILTGLLYIVILGIGMSPFVREIEGLPYVVFIAPGFLASHSMFAATFECTFGTFVRMELQKTFDGMMATPVSVEDVIGGELLWGATRTVVAAASILVVIGLAGLARSWWALATIPVAVLQGFVFAGMALMATSQVRLINSFSYYLNLLILPMFMLSGVFFPVESLPAPLRVVAWFLPLSHAARLHRGLVLGRLESGLLWDFVWLLVAAFVAANLAVWLLRRRLID